MSVWGGIGEGIAQGLKERMDREDQERRERMAQFNADRQFRFAQEQAARAQENADRTFEAGREDAARNQVNADRTFEANEHQRGVENSRADYRLAMDEERLAMDAEAQDWKNKLSSEQLRSFQAANAELDAKRRKRVEKEEMIAKGGYKQTVLAANRLLTGQGDKGKIVFDGQQVDATILNNDDLIDIYGKDNPWITDPQNGIESIAMIKTVEGDKIITSYGNGRSSVLGTGQLHSMAKFAWGDSEIADAYFGDEQAKKDLGMFAAKENIKATAQEKARNANDPYGNKRKIDAAVAILKADDSSESDRASALEYLGSVFGKSSSPAAKQTQIDPKIKAQAEARGFVYNEKTKRWEKKGRGSIAAPSAK